MKSKMLLVLALTTLASCNPFQGELTILQPTKVILKKTIFGNTKKATLRPGRYKSKIDFKSKAKAIITVSANKKYKIHVKLPNGDTFPRHSGSFSYTARELKQKFDLVGNVDTQITHSGTRSGYESCTYTRRKRVCRRVESATNKLRDRDRNGRGRGGDRDGRSRDRRDRRDRPRKVCTMEYVTVYGNQNVEFYYTYTDSDIDFEMISPGTDNLLGRFSGSRHSSNKNYTHRGICR